MPCEFTLEFQVDRDELFALAKNKIVEAGGELSGDSMAGSFAGRTEAGRFAGDYRMSDGTISFRIDRKPIAVSCRKIQRALAELLEHV